MYDTLAQQLSTEPAAIAVILEEGIPNQYSYTRRTPTGQPHRGRRIKTKTRNIIVPNLRLRAIQRKIAELLSSKFLPHPIAHGYARGRSIVSNAKIHVGATLLLRIDLANFFGSIAETAVVEALQRVLWEFTDDNIACIATLCCVNGFLPHGSPASPILSNMVCSPMDKHLLEFAESMNCRVSRFSDDIFFSTSAASFPTQLVETWAHGGPQDIELGDLLPALIDAHGFEINWNKVQIQCQGKRMQVTGVLVGTTNIGVPRYFRDNIRACIHQWDQHGLQACASKRQPAGCTRAFVSQLRGCIAHVGNVEGTDRQRFQRLSAALKTLLQRDKAQLCPIVDHLNFACEHRRVVTVEA